MDVSNKSRDKNKTHNFVPKDAKSKEEVGTKKTPRLNAADRLTAIGKLYEEKRQNLIKKKQVLEKEDEDKYIHI